MAWIQDHREEVELARSAGQAQLAILQNGNSIRQSPIQDELIRQIKGSLKALDLAETAEDIQAITRAVEEMGYSENFLEEFQAATLIQRENLHATFLNKLYYFKRNAAHILPPIGILGNAEASFYAGIASSATHAADGSYYPGYREPSKCPTID